MFYVFLRWVLFCNGVSKVKSIEDRAHEILLKMLEGINPMQLEKPTRDGLAYEAFELAEAMQAEAEKRKPMPNADPMRKVRESQWQPDWSVAPSWAKWWAVTKSGQGVWLDAKPSLSTLINDAWNLSRGAIAAPSFNYQGDWKDSLRKRPDTL